MFNNHIQVQAALLQRNIALSEFWFADPAERYQIQTNLQGYKLLVVDASDAFTQMLVTQLTALGVTVNLCSFDQAESLVNDYDLIVMGPGPGDPRSLEDSRIIYMRKTLRQLLAIRKPFLAVCLSHQLLCHELGFELIRKTSPNQGVQCEIDFFGARELVGFYNTFVGVVGNDTKNFDISFDKTSQEIHAIRSSHFVSMQFHPESILTKNGLDIIASSLQGIVA